jgi:amino acid adenylation domain-containing protein
VPALAALAVQYADFAAWQASPEAQERRADDLAFWRRQLAGAPPLLTLPTDRPRPAAQSLRGRQVAVRLAPALRAGLEAASRRHGVTPFMLLLAAFQVLLGRWSGQADVLVGTPVANRTRPEIEGLIGFFVNTLVLRAELLAAALAEPRRRLDELPLLAPAEAHQLRHEWNDTLTVYPPEPTLHGQIAAQARRSPAAVALRCDGREVSYGELDRRANRLAHHLRASGAGRGERVGIALERSPELVIGLLAILKAGAAYVPLDPGYPADRLGRMIEDACLPVVLTTRAIASQLPPCAAQRVLLDAESAEIAARPDREPAGGAEADDLAYLIFTSGSTGRPKAAMNSHRAIANRLYWMQQRFALTAADRVVHKTPIGFDVSVWELFWPLLQCACMVIAERGAHADVAYLRDLVIAEGATVAHFVPAVLSLFLDQPEVEACRTLRLVVASGEALGAELVRRFQARLGAALHNLYGPTEAAVDVTDWRCDEPLTRATAPIGRPIANLRIHVADAGLRLVPIGVAGELLIGGAGVGRGYAGRPELTAERFIPDPFAAAPGARLYRSGDLVLVRPRGEVEFLGRIDQQVKVRGVRIEPGEIEAALERLPQVLAAVVLAQPDAGGELALAAYLQLAAPGALDAQELRQALRRELPEVMVPATFDVVAAMPLSPNGKIDRRSLAGRRSAAAAPAARVAARGELERTVAALWCEVLGCAEVGVEDNFFDLGGHSLKLVEVQSRLRERSATTRTTSPRASPTSSTCAAPASPCRPPARRRWSPSTSPARACCRGECDMALAGGVAVRLPQRAATSTRRAASPRPTATAAPSTPRAGARSSATARRGGAQAPGRRAGRRRHRSTP